jgi:hypothetical protein
MNQIIFIVFCIIIIIILWVIIIELYKHDHKYINRKLLNNLIANNSSIDNLIKIKSQVPTNSIVTIHAFMKNNNTKLITFIKSINLKLLKLASKQILHKSINLKIWIFDNHKYSKHSDININKRQQYSELFNDITFCNIEDYFQFKEKFRQHIYNNYFKLLPCLLLISKTSKYDFSIIPYYNPITPKKLKQDSLNCIQYFKNTIFKIKNKMIK